MMFIQHLSETVITNCFKIKHFRELKSPVKLATFKSVTARKVTMQHPVFKYVLSTMEGLPVLFHQLKHFNV